MLKEVTFKELPEDMQQAVNGMNQVGSQMGEPEVKILKCQLEERRGLHVWSRCFVKPYEYCVEIFEKYSNNPVTSISLNSAEVSFLAKALGV